MTKPAANPKRQVEATVTQVLEARLLSECNSIVNQEVTFTVKFPKDAPPTLSQSALQALVKQKENKQGIPESERWTNRRQRDSVPHTAYTQPPSNFHLTDIDAMEDSEPVSQPRGRGTARFQGRVPVKTIVQEHPPERQVRRQFETAQRQRGHRQAAVARSRLEPRAVPPAEWRPFLRAPRSVTPSMVSVGIPRRAAQAATVGGRTSGVRRPVVRPEQTTVPRHVVRRPGDAVRSASVPRPGGAGRMRQNSGVPPRGRSMSRGRPW